MTALATPPLAVDPALEQRREVIQKANWTRTRRSQLKRDIKAGRESAGRILADPPDWARTMRVADVLLTVPKLGRGKVNRAFLKADVPPSKRIGDLTPQQLGRLVERLDGRLR